MLFIKALSAPARQQGRELTEIAEKMDADLVTGSSLKAALDLNWENPDERKLALGMVLQVLSKPRNPFGVRPRTQVSSRGSF